MLGAMAKIHIPDHLILPFGTATKADIQKIWLSSVAANGIYMTADVPVIYIDKSKKKALRLHNVDDVFPDEDKNAPDFNEGTRDEWITFFRRVIREHMPSPTRYEVMFLDLYFEMVTDSVPSRDWRFIFKALLPIPEMQVYVHDPLAESWSFEPNNNFRVDFGFWTGSKLVAVEIDGGEPEGYAKDIRRDRRADIDVIHILNVELQRHGRKAIRELIPREIFAPEAARDERPPHPPMYIPF
jgi:hypothetical protein